MRNVHWSFALCHSGHNKLTLVIRPSQWFISFSHQVTPMSDRDFGRYNCTARNNIGIRYQEFILAQAGEFVSSSSTKRLMCYFRLPSLVELAKSEVSSLQEISGNRFTASAPANGNSLICNSQRDKSYHYNCRPVIQPGLISNCSRLIYPQPPYAFPEILPNLR